MATWSIPLKTHRRTEITEQFNNLNECAVHKCKPHIFEMVVGRRKETMYTASCLHEDCGKIAYDKDAVIDAWNKWNP